MNGHRYVISGIALLVASLGLTAPASADFISGHMCHPETSADATRLTYSSDFGPYNSSNVPAKVVCPIANNPNRPLFLGVQVSYYNRNNAGLSCSVSTINADGNSTVSGPQTAPFNQAALQTFSFPVNANNNQTYLLHCTIPAAVSGSFSHITRISANN